MGKRLSQLNQVDRIEKEDYLLVDGEGYSESKKIALQDIDISKFNIQNFYEKIEGNFVKKDGDKGLSSNDFTDVDKNKLDTSQEKLISGSNIKTINGESILGSGNIEVQGGSVGAIDQTYNPESENAQSGKAVAKAVSDKQDSLVSGTNIKTINNQSILGSGNITIESGSDVEVDQAYNPTSENAQSGKAVTEAIASTVEIKPSKIDLPFEWGGGESGEYFAKLISIDKISNTHTRSYLRFEVGDSTLNAYVNCPKDELGSYGLEIGKFYLIKISGDTFSDMTMEIQKFSKISIDQTYNPNSTNAQSGIAVAEAIGDIETALDSIIEIQNQLIGGNV